jgi:hypothetical protein
VIQNGIFVLWMKMCLIYFFSVTWPKLSGPLFLHVLGLLISQVPLANVGYGVRNGFQGEKVSYAWYSGHMLVNLESKKQALF